MSKTGLTADRKSQVKRAQVSYPRSVGKKSTLYGINKCRADQCPTDASDLMLTLMGDKGFQEALKEDFKEVADFLAVNNRWR